ncbi:MAG: argininosuccinate synthase [Planctomycetes bacterium]|nr:argininosuccinate synthase [Planctomycetota bacterium]NUQ34062.1 argininosuccinate synthase [Planctomycetaceae bacterium]
MDKVVLAYSGGLETTAAIHWLKHTRHLNVIALAVNVGQGSDLDVVAERALAAGAAGVHVVDLRRTFLKKFCWKALKAAAKYEDRYFMSAALSRPLIATEAVRLAQDEGVKMIAHAAPPRGNDQFRLECSVAALAPDIEIVAPLREWKMKTREEVRNYAQKNGLDVDAKSNDQYTRDLNLWGARCSGGNLRESHEAANADAFVMTRDPLQAPEQYRDVTVSFIKGEPAKVDGERLESIELVEKLNALGGEHGVGRLETIEHSLMGFKIREVYEAPAATILHCAHDALERLVLDKDTLIFKRTTAPVYASAVYQGAWFSTLREGLDAFVQTTQEYVTGDITVRLYKGSATAISGDSEFSTYDREAVSFDKLGGSLPKGAAEGMLTIHRMLQLNRSFKQRPRL